MSLIVLGFFAVLVITFGSVILMTGRTPEERTIAQRMALIHISTKKPETNPELSSLFKVVKRGRFGPLDDFLEPYEFSKNLQLRILQANSSTTVANLIVTSLSLGTAGYCLTWLFNPMILLDIGGGALCGVMPFVLLTFKRSRRIKAFNGVLAEAIDMMARALRAGHSVASAMETLATNAQEPLAAEFGEIFRQVNLGLPMREALLLLLDRLPSDDLRVLITAILVQKDTGGNLAEILDRTVFVIRERLRIQGEIQTQTAQGRLTGWILSLLPVVMMVLLNLVNPGYSNILFHDPMGQKLLYISGGMLFVGSFIIRRLVNGIEV